MLQKQRFRLINGFVHHIKNLLFFSCSFTLVSLGQLILPIISYLSRGAYFLHLSSFPCFTACLPFSQNALGGLCCRWFSLLPLFCCQGMQIQPQNLLKTWGEATHLSGQGSVWTAAWSSTHHLAGNSQGFSPWHGADERGWDGHDTRDFWSQQRCTKTLKALLQHSWKKLHAAHMAHKTWHRQISIP